MAATMTIEMLSPAQRILSGSANSLTIPLEEGEAQIFPGSAAWLAKVATGHLIVDQGPLGRSDFFVDGGYLEVGEDGNCTVLVNTCEAALSIDGDRAKKALDRANKRIFDKSQVDADMARALYAKLKAEARLKVKSRGH